LQAHLRHFPVGKMASKCECVMTHSVLGILLANRLRFAGSDCHRADGFEPITPYPALVFMLFVPWRVLEKEKLPQYGRTGAPVALAVLVFCEPYHTRT